MAEKKQAPKQPISLEIEDYDDYGKNAREINKLTKGVKGVIRKTYWKGVFLVIFTLGGFGYWLVTANIDKASVAIGEIAVGGNNKTVQHLEGGIIEVLNVKEGDKVNEGQVLVVLSKTSATANQQIIETSLDASEAEYYRFVAERDGLKEVQYPREWYTPQNRERYEGYMHAQNQIFDEKRKAVVGKIGILGERNNQLTSEISGYQSQINSSMEQLQFNNQELATAQSLLASGNTTMSRVLALKGRKAEIEGRIGELKSSVSRAQQGIGENKLNMVNIKNDNLNEVVEKMKEVQAKINEFKERTTAASDTLRRTEILAPITGYVKDLKFKTLHGVIPPGAEIMTLVPSSSDDLIADIKIPPNDRDIVVVGLKCRVRLSSYSARHVPMMPGVLTYISADNFKDPQNQQAFYKGIVKIDVEEVNKHLDQPHDQILFPGMPVEVYITVGARSPLQYMIEPITRTFMKAFRED